MKNFRIPFRWRTIESSRNELRVMLTMRISPISVGITFLSNLAGFSIVSIIPCCGTTSKWAEFVYSVQSQFWHQPSHSAERRIEKNIIRLENKKWEWWGADGVGGVDECFDEVSKVDEKRRKDKVVKDATIRPNFFPLFPTSLSSISLQWEWPMNWRSDKGHFFLSHRWKISRNSDAKDGFLISSKF